MKRKYGIILFFTMVLAIAYCIPASAHNVWLNPGTHFPQVGETVDIGIGWGHSYPASREDQEMKDGRLEEIVAVDPDRLPVALTKVSAALYQLKVEKPGAYLITAKITSGFFTTTPEGRKWGNKTEVSDAVKCTNYHIGAKTVLIVGGEARNLGHVTGQTLELIPLTDPADLKQGKAFSFKVLFEGKPVAGVSVKAKYAGFDDEQTDEEASQNTEMKKKSNYPCEAETDDAGMATIMPTQPGYWLMTLSNTSDYPDLAVCDQCRYSMAFTFEVR